MNGHALFTDPERTAMGCSDPEKRKEKERVEVNRRSLITIKCADRWGENGMSSQLKIGIFKFKISLYPLIFTQRSKQAGCFSGCLHWIIRNQD